LTPMRRGRSRPERCYAVGHRGTRGAWRRHGSERGRRVRRRRLDERPVGFHLRAARTTRTAVQRRNRLDEHGLQGPPGPGLRRAPEELAGAVAIGALMGRRTAIVTTRPCRTPHHTIADVGLIGGARCPCRARSRWHIMAGSFSMNCRSSADMSWRCCGNRWRRGRIQTISRTSSICERWQALALRTQHVSSQERRGALRELSLDRGSIP
jgi:hypothetical protein